MEDLMHLAAQPVGFAGCAFTFIGLIYLGIVLRDGASGGGGEIRKALAMIAAGAALSGFAAVYGFVSQ